MASNADRLREMYDRFWRNGDLAAGRGVMSPDIVWDANDMADLGGRREGIREVGAFFSEWLDSWEEYDNDHEFHEIAPDIVLVRSYFHGRGKGSGIELGVTLGQVWEFEDGLAVRQTMYRSVEEARRVAEELARDGRV